MYMYGRLDLPVRYLDLHVDLPVNSRDRFYRPIPVDLRRNSYVHVLLDLLIHVDLDF